MQLEPCKSAQNLPAHIAQQRTGPCAEVLSLAVAVLAPEQVELACDHPLQLGIGTRLPPATQQHSLLFSRCNSGQARVQSEHVLAGSCRLHCGLSGDPTPLKRQTRTGIIRFMGRSVKEHFRCCKVSHVHGQVLRPKTACEACGPLGKATVEGREAQARSDRRNTELSLCTSRSQERSLQAVPRRLGTHSVTMRARHRLPHYTLRLKVKASYCAPRSRHAAALACKHCTTSLLTKGARLTS